MYGIIVALDGNNDKDSLFSLSFFFSLSFAVFNYSFPFDVSFVCLLFSLLFAFLFIMSQLGTMEKRALHRGLRQILISTDCELCAYYNECLSLHASSQDADAADPFCSTDNTRNRKSTGYSRSKHTLLLFERWNAKP